MGEVGIVHVRLNCFRIPLFNLHSFFVRGVGVVSAGHFYGTLLPILERLEKNSFSHPHCGEKSGSVDPVINAPDIQDELFVLFIIETLEFLGDRV